MTLEINEASKIIIQMGNSYSSCFQPSNENLIIFKGLLAFICEDYLLENIIERLPWSVYQMEIQGNFSSVESYLLEPYKITEKLTKIINDP